MSDWPPQVGDLWSLGLHMSTLVHDIVLIRRVNKWNDTDAHVSVLTDKGIATNFRIFRKIDAWGIGSTPRNPELISRRAID